VVPKIWRWLGREDAPLLFRPRPDWAQWRWGLGFLRECMPGRFEHNVRELAGLASYSRDCLRALRAETGIQYDALTRGILHFCTDERDFEALGRHADTMRALGIRREIKTRGECLAIEPALESAQVVGGVYTPDDESGDAHAFTIELARRCERNGVRFVNHCIVAGLEADGERAVGVRGESGLLEADAYVVALGSYSPLILRPLGIHVPVYPLKGYSVTLPLSGMEKAAPTVSLTDEARKIVISRLGDRLRAAGTAELTGYDRNVNERRCNAILERMRTLFPALAGIEPSHRWAGLRPATPSNVPCIGKTRLRNLYVNTGHGTLGWTLACGSAAALADLIAGRKPDVNFQFQ
jgi:D-amino-acid dehydrogenase